MFGLKSMYNQSEASFELHNLEKAVAAGKTNAVAKFETRKLCRTGKTVREFHIAYHKTRNEAFGFQRRGKDCRSSRLV